MAYLRNCWYMAAWADEIAPDATLVRTFLDEPVLLFRDAAGAPRALLDRCPHRFAPLSKGQVSDGIVACAYHGLQFGGDGACVANPHGPITTSMSVRSYPVMEAYRALWIWMGEASRADHALLRDLSFLSDAPNSAFSKGYVLGRGNYQLFVDNILDLSHVDYLHPTTLGGGAITRTKAKVEESDDGVLTVKWHLFNEVPGPLLRSLLPPSINHVDSWTEAAWTAPAMMTLTSGAVPAGAPRGGAGNSLNVHIMTPETETTTHYFFAATRDYRLDDEVLNERVRKIRDQIFSTEDEPMIRAQQERIGDSDFAALRPVLLPIDEAPVRVRRRLEALIASERPAASSQGSEGDRMVA